MNTLGEGNERKITVKISSSTKAELDKIKIIPEEPYDKVVKRLIEVYKKKEVSA